MSEAAYGDASALHARRVPPVPAPTPNRRGPRPETPVPNLDEDPVGFSHMSRAALPGAHTGADASSARVDPSEEEVGEEDSDGDAVGAAGEEA